MEELDYLLSLDGEIFPMENGYWVKFEAKKVEESDKTPQGVKYSLTLHDNKNRRVLGYDNAHSYKPKQAKFGAKKVTYDHIHKKDDIFPYEFENSGQLMEDFWNDVSKIIDDRS